MTPLAWLGILAILLVIEAITVGLTTVWFAGGALVACIVSWLGGGIVVQLLLFFGVSVVLLIFTRPLAVRYMNKGVEKTNAESLLGKRAVVIQPINNLAQTGQVRINDIEWTARSADESVEIPAGAVVEIKEIRGVKLIVKEDNKEGWSYCFACSHRSCIVGTCILHPHCAAGLCCGTGTSWRLQSYLEHRYSFQGSVH